MGAGEDQNSSAMILRFGILNKEGKGASVRIGVETFCPIRSRIFWKYPETNIYRWVVLLVDLQRVGRGVFRILGNSHITIILTLVVGFFKDQKRRVGFHATSNLPLSRDHHLLLYAHPIGRGGIGL